MNISIFLSHNDSKSRPYQYKTWHSCIVSSDTFIKNISSFSKIKSITSHLVSSTISSSALAYLNLTKPVEHQLDIRIRVIYDDTGTAEELYLTYTSETT